MLRRAGGQDLPPQHGRPIQAAQAGRGAKLDVTDPRSLATKLL